jgi:hypothetical protein
LQQAELLRLAIYAAFSSYPHNIRHILTKSAANPTDGQRYWAPEQVTIEAELPMLNSDNIPSICICW